MLGATQLSVRIFIIKAMENFRQMFQNILRKKEIVMKHGTAAGRVSLVTCASWSFFGFSTNCKSLAIFLSYGEAAGLNT